MKVSWGYDSQYMESHKTHVPNHQPAIVLTIIILTKNYITIIVPVDDLHGIYMVFTWYLHGIYLVFTCANCSSTTNYRPLKRILKVHRRPLKCHHEKIGYPKGTFSRNRLSTSPMDYNIYIYMYIINMYIYIYRLKAGGSPELRGTLSLDAIPESSFLYTDGGGGGGGGGVITSCEVRWMMLNPGRCCLVGRWCYVASFDVVYRRGGGGVGVV